MQMLELLFGMRIRTNKIYKPVMNVLIIQRTMLKYIVETIFLLKERHFFSTNGTNLLSEELAFPFYLAKLQQQYFYIASSSSILL